MNCSNLNFLFQLFLSSHIDKPSLWYYWCGVIHLVSASSWWSPHCHQRGLHGFDCVQPLFSFIVLNTDILFLWSLIKGLYSYLTWLLIANVIIVQCDLSHTRLGLCRPLAADITKFVKLSRDGERCLTIFTRKFENYLWKCDLVIIQSKQQSSTVVHFDNLI